MYPSTPRKRVHTLDGNAFRDLFLAVTEAAEVNSNAPQADRNQVTGLPQQTARQPRLPGGLTNNRAMTVIRTAKMAAVDVILPRFAVLAREAR